LNLPDDPTRLIHELKVSRQDAVYILESCGLGAELARPTPEEIVQEGQARGLLDKEIAANIDAEYFGDDHLIHEKLGILLRGQRYSPGADKQKGKRARGKKT
jgi:hypothetical protein